MPNPGENNKTGSIYEKQRRNLVTLSYTSVGKVNLMSTVLYSTVHTVHIRLDLGLIDIRRGAQIKKYANHR